MPEYYNKSAPAGQPEPADYDLEEEKKIVAEATIKIRKELVEKWQKRYAGAVVLPKKLAGMNREVTDFLLSFQMTLFYDDLAKNLKLDKNQRDLVPQLVWDISLRKNWDGLIESSIKELRISEESAAKINDLVQKNILSKIRELSSKKVSTNRSFPEKNEKTSLKITMPLAEIIKKYPEINDQLITSDSIKLINNSELVRPTFKNWLNDYTLRHGYKKHTTVERGSFLFQSENGRKLTPGDREKLSQVIKSFDQESQLNVDTVSKKVLFRDQSDIKTINVVSEDKK